MSSIGIILKWIAIWGTSIVLAAIIVLGTMFAVYILWYYIVEVCYMLTVRYKDSKVFFQYLKDRDNFKKWLCEKERQQDDGTKYDTEHIR